MTIQGLLMLAALLTSVTVKADFILTVKFINYTNPSGLCAECNTRLGEFIVPVCCDEMPLRTENCNNTGESRCDTRFHWVLREYGKALQTRPGSAMSETQRVYFFNPCGQSFAMCPFSETSRTFEQGDTAFLGSSNPFLADSTESWTGRIQFFIQSVESTLPNIIDSFLIDLDDLQLGADFTEEITYTGYHNISQMRMSFRLECAPDYCGPDCTINSDDRKVLNCPTGEATCINDKLDPSLLCAGCIDNRLDISTDCLTCLNTAYDPVTNCSTCSNPEYNFASGCSKCLDAVYNPATSCSTCLDAVYDPATSCSTCWNTAYDPATNCSTCLNPNFVESADCTTCLKDGYSPATNCSLCLPNRDLSTNCTSCLPGWDLDSDCTSCSLPRSDPNSNCTTCLSGYTGEDCLAVTLSAALVGGIAGGVGGGLFLVIVILIVIVIVLTCRHKRRGSGNIVSGTTAIDMKQNIVYGITGTAGERQPTTDDIELQPNVLYGTTGQQTGPGSGDQTTYVNEGLGPTAAEKDPATEYEYIQI